MNIIIPSSTMTLINNRKNCNIDYDDFYTFSWNDLPNYILSDSITSDIMENITIIEPDWTESEKRLYAFVIGKRILLHRTHKNNIIIHYITKRITFSYSKWEHYIVIYKDTEYTPFSYDFTLCL